MNDEKVSLNELSDAAHFALAYVRAQIAGPGTPAYAAFEEGVKRMDMDRISGADRRKSLGRGLAELRERGVIECRKDGEGDLVPTILHEERLVPAEGRIIASDFN